jgi:hypothetical protein
VVPNRISHELSQQKVDEIMAHLAAIQEALPFLVGLSGLERQRLLKAGDRSQAFISKASEVGQHIVDHLPGSLDLGEMRKDVALRGRLYPVMLAISTLAEKLSDTYALVSSEAYAAALVIYRTAKTVKGGEGLEQAVAELGSRFERRPARAAAASDSSAQS